MARHKEEAKKSPSPQARVTVLKPPAVFTGIRWFFFCATVAIAIGMLAMLNKHLVDLPWVYDGPQKQWQGRTVKISYCLLSPSKDFSADINCDFGFATASVSLAISLVWSYLQALRHNPFRHPRAKWLDLLLSLTGLAWWLASAIILSVWTDRANKAGLPRNDWRNGLCALAWAQVLMFAGLAATSAILSTNKSQAMFDKYQQKRIQNEEAKLRKMKDDVEAQNAAAAAAAATAAAAAPRPAAAAAATPASAAGRPLQQQQQLPVSTHAGTAAAGGGAGSSAAGADAGAVDGGAANPFLAEGVQDSNPFLTTADKPAAAAAVGAAGSKAATKAAGK